MVWRPGPAIDEDITFSDHDERDPWIKRFISRTDDGQLSLDVEVIYPLGPISRFLSKESIAPHSAYNVNH